jgi:hypothetical protein
MILAYPPRRAANRVDRCFRARVCERHVDEYASEPAGTMPQHQLPRAYRRAAAGAAVLLLAGGFVGALNTPGVTSLVGYGVSAVVAGAVGFALYLATRRNRGYQSTQTTALASGVFVLLALVNMLMIVAAVVFGPPARIVEFRFGILLVTVLLALIIGGIGIFGVARGQRCTWTGHTARRGGSPGRSATGSAPSPRACAHPWPRMPSGPG